MFQFLLNTIYLFSGWCPVFTRTPPHARDLNDWAVCCRPIVAQRTITCWTQPHRKF